MDGSKLVLTVPESQSMQQQQGGPVDLHHVADIKHRVPAHLLPGTSTMHVLSTPALDPSLSEVNTKHLTDILYSAPMDTDQHRSEPAMSASESLVSQTVIQPHTYISQSHIPVFRDQPMTMASDSDLGWSGPNASVSSQQESSQVPTEDTSATLQTLFSSFSQLQQFFAKNSQLLIKSSIPMQSPVNVESKHGVVSSDPPQVELPEYYAKSDSEQVDRPASAHSIPLIQVPNPALYRYSQLAQTNRDASDNDSVEETSVAPPTSPCSSAATSAAATAATRGAQHSYESAFQVPSHSARIHSNPDTLVDNSESLSQQNIMDRSLILKEEKLSTVEQSHTADEFQYSQDQLEGYYHGLLVNPVERGSPSNCDSTLVNNGLDTKAASLSWTYSEAATVRHHNQAISKNVDLVSGVDIADMRRSSPVLNSKQPERESSDPVPEQSVSEECICDQLQTADDNEKNVDDATKPHADDVTQPLRTSKLKKKHVSKNRRMFL